jgi:hypothetical protein
LAGREKLHLPGLYTFRAATIGDGFLLPLLAYSLVRSAGLHRRGGTSRTVLSRAGAIAGASAGLAVQAYSLADPDPRLDWTFPAPHSYDLPGWYHTFFLVVASGFYGWALGLVLARIRQEAQANMALALRRVRSVGSLGILIPMLAFVGLLAEDDLSWTPEIVFAVLAAMIYWSVMVCAALWFACGPRVFQWCALTVLGCLLPAIALCILFLPGQATATPAVLSAAAVGLAVLSLAHISLGSSRRQIAPAARRSIIACVALCAIGPMYALSAGGPPTVARLAVGCLAGLLLAACELGILKSVLRAQPQRG